MNYVTSDHQAGDVNHNQDSMEAQKNIASLVVDHYGVVDDSRNCTGRTEEPGEVLEEKGEEEEEEEEDQGEVDVQGSGAVQDVQLERNNVNWPWRSMLMRSNGTNTPSTADCSSQLPDIYSNIPHQYPHPQQVAVCAQPASSSPPTSSMCLMQDQPQGGQLGDDVGDARSGSVSFIMSSSTTSGQSSTRAPSQPALAAAAADGSAGHLCDAASACTNSSINGYNDPESALWGQVLLNSSTTGRFINGFSGAVIDEQGLILDQLAVYNHQEELPTVADPGRSSNICTSSTDLLFLDHGGHHDLTAMQASWEQLKDYTIPFPEHVHDLAAAHVDDPVHDHDHNSISSHEVVKAPLAVMVDGSTLDHDDGHHHGRLNNFQRSSHFVDDRLSSTTSAASTMQPDMMAEVSIWSTAGGAAPSHKHHHQVQRGLKNVDHVEHHGTSGVAASDSFMHSTPTPAGPTSSNVELLMNGTVPSPFIQQTQIEGDHQYVHHHPHLINKVDNNLHSSGLRTSDTLVSRACWQQLRQADRRRDDHQGLQQHVNVADNVSCSSIGASIAPDRNPLQNHHLYQQQQQLHIVNSVQVNVNPSEANWRGGVHHAGSFINCMAQAGSTSTNDFSSAAMSNLLKDAVSCSGASPPKLAAAAPATAAAVDFSADSRPSTSANVNRAISGSTSIQIRSAHDHDQQMMIMAQLSAAAAAAPTISSSSISSSCCTSSASSTATNPPPLYFCNTFIGRGLQGDQHLNNFLSPQSTCPRPLPYFNSSMVPQQHTPQLVSIAAHVNSGAQIVKAVGNNLHRVQQLESAFEESKESVVLLDQRKTPASITSCDNFSEGGNTAASSTAGLIKRPRMDNSSASAPTTTSTVTKQTPKKEKLGDRIATLQQLVAPFGKTDTASVLLEAIGYIKFLQDQVQALSSPYMKTSSCPKDVAGAARRKAWPNVLSCNGSNIVSADQQNNNGPGGSGSEELHNMIEGAAAPAIAPVQDLRSRGLCLVPVSCTLHVANVKAAECWTATYAGAGIFRS